MAVSLSNEQIIAAYNLDVEKRIAKYESLNFEQFHPEFLPFLPSPPAKTLDIGAGSGRDAAYLAQKGYLVTAVEPAAKLLAAAQKQHKNVDLRWVVDKLPELKELAQEQGQYDLILLSAVWMHLSSSERKDSFKTLAQLLKVGGVVMISYKIGGSEDEGFYIVDHHQFDRRAEAVGLNMLYQNVNQDSLGRKELSWRCCVLIKQ